MLAHRQAPSAVVFALMLVALDRPASVAAQPPARLDAELRAAGGYDSNPSFSVDPGARRLPEGAMGGGPVPGPPGRDRTLDPDGLLRLDGFVEGAFGRPWELRGRFDVHGRVYGSGDVLFHERLAIRLDHLLDDGRLGCGVEGARLDASFIPDDAFSGELACGGSWSIDPTVLLALDGVVGLRAFDLGQLDLIGGGRARALFAPIPELVLDLGLGAFRRESDERFATRTDVFPSVRARLTIDAWGTEVGYLAALRVFDQDARSGHEHIGRARGWFRPLPWLELFAEVELGIAEGGPQAIRYERVQALLGLAVIARAELEPAALPELPRAQGPAEVEAGAITFTFVLPRADDVRVIGTFNAWDPERGRLRDEGGGRFVGRFPASAGRHRYQLIVDGEPTRAPGAARYAPDDFGADDAIVEVPADP